MHGGYHRDSSHRYIGILEDKKIETLQVSKHWEDLDRPFEDTRGGDRGSLSGVGISIFPWTGDRGNPK